jgi:2,4-dienoyl-CoA reductase-like NADH-dependent reductase (Old Yellow Enzyme family)
MTGIYDDRLVPALKKLADAVHDEGGKIVVQINHGGAQCSEESVDTPAAPSSVELPNLKRKPREMSGEEISATIQAYADAARRAKEAGFDGVQIHGAHGYLISQFISPLTNQREDHWGGSIENRTRFLREVIRAVRGAVGNDYPLLIKFGMMDGMDGGLMAEEGAQILARFEEYGLDGIEISTGFGGEKLKSIQKGVRKPEEEAYLLPLVDMARPFTDLPLLAVGGFRSRKIMERALLSGVADFISLCRPLIREPDLPRLLETDQRQKSACLSANNCWPEGMGEGISCKCPPLPDEEKAGS